MARKVDVMDALKESLNLVISFFVLSFVLGWLNMDIVNQWVSVPAVGLDMGAVALIIGVAVALIVKQQLVDEFVKLD